MFVKSVRKVGKHGEIHFEDTLKFYVDADGRYQVHMPSTKYLKGKIECIPLAQEDIDKIMEVAGRTSKARVKQFKTLLGLEN